MRFYFNDGEEVVFEEGVDYRILEDFIIVFDENGDKLAGISKDQVLYFEWEEEEEEEEEEEILFETKAIR